MAPQAERGSRAVPAGQPARPSTPHAKWETQIDPQTRSLLEELRELRVTLVHDWLVRMGGGERVLAVFHQMFPRAPIHTMVLDRTRLLPDLRDADIRTAFTDRLPLARSNFRALLPLYPSAVRQFDLSGYHLVVSSSSAFAKGVRVRKPAVHVCYCHTPMRFAWHFDEYVAREALPRPAKLGARVLVPWLRRWDRRTCEGIDLLVANSEEVRRRIRRFWGREAQVIHPPVDVDRFQFASPEEVGDYFLVVSRLVAYRRIDVAVRAAELAGVKLLVVGDGPDRPRLERLAGPTVHFLGRLDDREVARLMARCIALLTPGIEDFGIAPLEANAAGRPVLARAAGGALETVKDGETGLLLSSDDPAEWADTLRRVAASPRWEAPASRLRAHAERFAIPAFVRQMVGTLVEAVRNGGAAREGRA